MEIKQSKKPKTILTDLGLIYTSAIWGSTFYVVKNSLVDIDPVIQVGYRFLLAALMLAAFLLFKRIPLFTNFRSGLVLGIILLLIYVPQTIGLKFTSAANSAFISGLFIAFVPLFGLFFFRHRSTRLQWLAVGISLLGLWILTGGLAEINIGDWMTILAAMGYAAHILFADRLIKKKTNPYVLAFQQFLVVGVLSLLIGGLFDLPFSIASMKTIWVTVFLAVFPTLSAFVIMFLAQKHTAPLKLSLIFALEPVFGAVFAWTLGGELSKSMQLLGGLLIFDAILLSALSEKETI